MPSAKRTIDHREIRRWVEQHGGHPATVKRTRSKEDVGMLRIDFPGFSGETSLEPIGWDEWFSKFDRQKLAFLYQEGKNTNFNKLVRREPDEERPSDTAGTPSRTSQRRGATATGTGRAASVGSTRRVGAAPGRRNAPARGRAAAAATRQGEAMGNGGTSRRRATRTSASRSRVSKNGRQGKTVATPPSESGTTRTTRSRTTRARPSAASPRAAGPRQRRAKGGEDLQRLTRAQLYERAQSVGIPQRSGMSKSELVEALQSKS